MLFLICNHSSVSVCLQPCWPFTKRLGASGPVQNVQLTVPLSTRDEQNVNNRTTTPHLEQLSPRIMGLCKTCSLSVCDPRISLNVTRAYWSQGRYPWKELNPYNRQCASVQTCQSAWTGSAEQPTEKHIVGCHTCVNNLTRQTATTADLSATQDVIKYLCL